MAAKTKAKTQKNKKVAIWGKKNKRTAGKRPLASKKKKPILAVSRSRKPVKIIRKIKDMTKFVQQLHARNKKVALVPTMGYLHEGHQRLVQEAKKHAQVVIVSVFVNPTQFLPQEDLDRYPRDFAGDRRKLQQVGTDVMFVPDSTEMYPEGFQTYLDVNQVTRNYCGASRPGHFRGVATIVAKLFNIVKPDVAVFGEKDYQQLVTIRQMVQDLNMDIEVIGVPTVREEDGLAMSSRNAYLSPAQRQQATVIHRGLRKAKQLLDNGERDAAEISAMVLDLLREEQDLVVDYVAVCDPETLERIPEIEREAVLLVAAKIGDTRLIDNIRLDTKRRK